MVLMINTGHESSGFDVSNDVDRFTHNVSNEEKLDGPPKPVIENTGKSKPNGNCSRKGLREFRGTHKKKP